MSHVMMIDDDDDDDFSTYMQPKAMIPVVMIQEVVFLGHSLTAWEQAFNLDTPAILKPVWIYPTLAIDTTTTIA